MSAIASSPATVHYREAFARLQPQLGGTASLRVAAMQRFAELGFPGARDEAWKYTSLRRLESRRFVPAAPTTTSVDVPPAFVAQRLVLANGSAAGPVPAAFGGFTLGTLQTAPEDQLLRTFVGGGTERFAALNAALTIGPLLLSTAAGQRSDDVVQLSLLTTGTGPTLASPRIAVRMAPGSRARLLIDHVDDGAHEHFTNAVLDIELGAGAHLTLYRLQRQGERAFHVERIESRVGENACFVLRDSQLGAALARLDTHVSLDGRAAGTRSRASSWPTVRDTSTRTSSSITVQSRRPACRITAASRQTRAAAYSTARRSCTQERRSRMLARSIATCC